MKIANIQVRVYGPNGGYTLNSDRGTLDNTLKVIQDYLSKPDWNNVTISMSRTND